MNRAAVVWFVLAALAGVAGAEMAVPPPGWKYDEAYSRSLTRNAQGTAYFGATPTTSIKVVAYIAQSKGLFVVRAEATVTPAQRNLAATRALFELVDGARRQGTAQIESSSQRVDPSGTLLESSITWRDPAGIRQIARTIVTGDATRLVAHHGQCILPLDVSRDDEAACAEALTTLDHGTPPDTRVALAIVDAPAETELPSIAAAEATAPGTGSAAPATMGSPSARNGEQPRLGDGGRTPMPPMTIAPAKREVDRRPLYLGGGIVILAAIFWWNRRRRDRFDREEPPAAAPAESEPSSGDDDADDLQAAARGDAPKEEP